VGAGADPYVYTSYVDDELFGRRWDDAPDGYGDQLRMVLANYENPEKGSDRSPRIVITATTVHGEAIVVASSVGGRMHPLFSHTACQSSPR
jgi:hypothetical protein